MSVIFGILSINSHTLDNGPVNSVLLSASMDGKRKLSIYRRPECILGFVDFSDRIPRIVHDTKSKTIFLMGGEFFPNTNIQKIPNLNSLFDENISTLNGLDGHYALVRYYEASCKLSIVNDVLGLFPIYIAKTKDVFVFSSEYQIVVPFLDSPRRLDKQFLGELALYGFSCEGRTPLEKLKTLPPATHCSLSNEGDIHVNSYCNWNYTINYNSRLEDNVDSVIDNLQQSLISFVSDGEVKYLPLTGGFDSRLLMLLLPEKLRKDFKFVTNCSPYLPEDQDRDVSIAKQIANMYGLSHRVDHLAQMQNFMQEGTLYESLRPVREWYNVQGHFSGYLRGVRPDFSSIEINQTRIFSNFFSEELRKRLTEEFKPITAYPDYFNDENRDLKYYAINNMRCFMNSDPLTSGKWVNPVTMYSQHLRSPFGTASLIRLLLTVPKRQLMGGRLFLSLFYKLDKRSFQVPFTSVPFPKETTDEFNPRPENITSGTDYQSVRKRIWENLFVRYFYRPKKRNIYSTKTKTKLATKYFLEYSPASRLIPQCIIMHWRYAQVLPEKLVQDYIRVEDWLRFYADTSTSTSRFNDNC